MHKILIISTTFYPDPGVSAIRMTQWCRHLPAHGWQPHVLCRYYGFDATPEELAANVHPDVSVTYLDRPQSGTVPAAASRRGGFLRRQIGSALAGGAATLAVPDVSVYAWRRFRRQILAHVESIRPDVILTTSPPHSNHDVGAWLTEETGIPWVADFRDPYLLDQRFRPKGIGSLRWGAHRRFKNLVYGRARLVTHAIPLQARWARLFMPTSRERVRVLTNAFPSELLHDLAEPRPDGSGRKTVLVAGTIPEPEQLRLAKAVAVLVREGYDVQLKLVGRRPDGEAQLRSVLGERVILTDYLSHRESIRAVAQADVLVNYLDEFRRRTLLLSTKLFEYLASGKPVICVNPSRSDRHLLLGRSGVSVLHHPNVDELAADIGRALAKPSERSAKDLAEFRANFNWEARVEQLARWLDQIVAFPPVSAPVMQRAAAPAASVVVPTRNRKELLRQCLRSALAQSVPVEVIVMDDGSTDGTVEMVRQEFPGVKLCQLGQGKGPCFQRNRGIEMAAADVVFAVDDDAIFSTPRVVEQTLADFDHPRIAAVGIPFLNPRLSWVRQQWVPSANGTAMVSHAYVGASHAIRRDVFLRAGGYREHFFYMGEEGDLCLRLLQAGYVVRLGTSDPIYHMESPRRDLAMADSCGRRNDVLFAWHNVPTPMLPVHLLGTTLNGLRSGIQTRHLFRMLRGTVDGFVGCWRHWNERAPVTDEIYRLHRRLKKAGSASLDEVEPQLPPLSED